MKITVGILCYNEKDLIRPCIESLVDWADEIIISDGIEWGEIHYQGESFEKTCLPSTDGTLEIVNEYEEKYDHIKCFHLHGSEALVEKDIRSIQLSMATGDWFLIVDADEIWDRKNLDRLRAIIESGETLDYVALHCRNFFYDANTFIDQYHKRLFKIVPGRMFYGVNEMEGDDEYTHIPQEEVSFFHYGYVDKNRVKIRCDRFDSDYYNNCGPWWYENVYLKYDGTNFDELCQINGGSFHLMGRRHPGYGKWKFTVDDEQKHPIVMQDYFRKLGIDASYMQDEVERQTVPNSVG